MSIWETSKCPWHSKSGEPRCDFSRMFGDRCTRILGHEGAHVVCVMTTHDVPFCGKYWYARVGQKELTPEEKNEQRHARLRYEREHAEYEQSLIWKMPEWMEPFRSLIKSFPYTVEECLNEWSTHTRLPTEEVTVQVELLEQLHNRGWLIKDLDPNLCGCGLPFINGNWCSGGHYR